MFWAYMLKVTDLSDFADSQSRIIWIFVRLRLMIPIFNLDNKTF